MKFTQPIVLAALLLATSSAALPMGETFEIYARADPSTLVGRAATEGGLLMERSPSIFGKVFKVAKGFLGFKREEPLELHARSVYDDGELYTRSYEDEELFAREYVKAGALVERSPSIFGKVFKVAKGFLGFKREEPVDLQARSADELVERSPSIFGKVFKVAKGFLPFKREEPVDLQARAADELVQRSPSIFGKIAKVAKGFLGFKREEALTERSEEDLYTRMEDEELFQRFDDDELVTRSEGIYERDFEVEY